MKSAVATASESKKTVDQLRRVIQIWKARRVFPPEFIANLVSHTTALPAPQPVVGTPQGLPQHAAARLSNPVTQSLVETEDSDSQGAQWKRNVDHIKPHVFDASAIESSEGNLVEFSKEVEQVIRHIEQYRSYLQSNLKTHASLLSNLNDTLNTQRDEVANTQKRFSACAALEQKVKTFIKLQQSEKVQTAVLPV